MSLKIKLNTKSLQILNFSNSNCYLDLQAVVHPLIGFLFFPVDFSLLHFEYRMNLFRKLPIIQEFELSKSILFFLSKSINRNYSKKKELKFNLSNKFFKATFNSISCFCTAFNIKCFMPSGKLYTFFLGNLSIRQIYFVANNHFNNIVCSTISF